MKTAVEAIHKGANWALGINRDYPLVSLTTGRELNPIASPLPIIMTGTLQREGDQALLLLDKGSLSFSHDDPTGGSKPSPHPRCWVVGRRTAMACLSRGSDGAWWVELLDGPAPDDPVLVRMVEVAAKQEARRWL